MMSEYRMSLAHVMKRLPLVAGLALAEARSVRLAPGGGPDYTDRVAGRAMDEERARIEREYTIID